MDISHTRRDELDIKFGMQKYWRVIGRQWLPAVAVFSGVMSIAILSVLTGKTVYQANGKVLVKVDRSSTLVDVGRTGLDNIGDLKALGRLSDPIVTAVESMRAVENAERTIDVLEMTDETGERLSPVDFLSSLDISPVPGTDMIRVKYDSAYPELAADTVNAFIDSYIENNVAENQAEAEQASKLLSDQIPEAEAAVIEAETALRRFQEGNQVVVLEQEAAAAVQSLSDLDQRISEAQARLDTLDAESSELQQQLQMSPETAVVASSLSQSPAIQDVLLQVQSLQSELDIARTRYRGSHPAVTSLEEQERALLGRLQFRVAEQAGELLPVNSLQIGELEQALSADLVRIEVERTGIARQINNLLAQRDRQQERAGSFPGLEQFQRQLQRDLTTAQTTYESLTRRLQDIQIAAVQPVGNVSVVSQALVPTKPVSNQAALKLLISGFLALMLAVAAAFIADLLNKGFKSTEDILEWLEHPVVGAIPRDVSRQPSAFHLLQLNLRLSNSHQSPKVIAVTSSVVGEQTSDVAVGLAKSMAKVGHRVLLIDANFTERQQSHLLNLSGKPGLIEMLYQENIGLEDAVYSLQPNLDVLVAGGANSVARRRQNNEDEEVTMFTPEYVQALIDEAKERYDTIVLETSPLTTSTEAFVVGGVVDGTLMVVQPSVVTLPDIQLSQPILAHLGAPVLGLVLNGVKGASQPNSYLTYSKDVRGRWGYGDTVMAANGKVASADHYSMTDYTLDGLSERN
ncbi:MAG: polysaccharide biosynthesis tyrosine autokinase [Cyanobacteria bacterium P01_B01_bin.77]